MTDRPGYLEKPGAIPGVFPLHPGVELSRYLRGRAWLTALALWLAALGGLAALAGCGVGQLARGELQPPRVALKAFRVDLPTAEGWPLAAVLLLENPNPQPINLLGYDYEVWLEGISVAQGASQEAVNLPALGQTTAVVPILVKMPAVLRILPTLRHQPPRLHYQIAGGFRLASLLGGLIRVPFRFQGEFAPREAMELLQPYLR
jgi:LEA14-like dessication related protein